MSKRKKYLTCSRKYDSPLFCAAWFKYRTHSVYIPSGILHVVFGGGGGDRKSGLMNRLVLAEYDFDTDELSTARSTLSTDDDPPYRLAVHPGSNDIVCSVSKSCRLIIVKVDDGLRLESSENVLRPLQDVGEQNCLAFSTDGTKLATGGEDGHLRVFEWPSLKLMLDEPSAHQSVKDLDFSLDSSLLASTGDSGPCRIWDITKASAVTSLSSNKGESFGYCRFSRDGTRQILYVTVRNDGKGSIGLWESLTWKKVGAKRLTNVPISAFSMSPDGKLLAMGSSEGDVSIVDAKRLVVSQRLKSAHMVFVTSMEFAPNGRALLSVSGDSSARVTAIASPSGREGYKFYFFMLIVFLISTWLFWAYKEAHGDKSVGAYVHQVMARFSRFNSISK